MHTALAHQNDEDASAITFHRKPALWEIPTFEGSRLDLDRKLEKLSDRLAAIAHDHVRAPLASSLSVEDVLLADIILTDLPEDATRRLPVITLQTGSLHKETLKLLTRLRDRYGPDAIEVYLPDPMAVAGYIKAHGASGMYESVPLRQACCRIRKLEPLERALKGADGWITGRRQDQGLTRRNLEFVEIDPDRDVQKYNPLADWSEAEVWAAIKLRQLPFNDLYLRGYPSIGCEPCTCAVKAGADIRSGRWWWETRQTKECGLHTTTG